MTVSDITDRGQDTNDTLDTADAPGATTAPGPAGVSAGPTRPALRQPCISAAR